jgi:very-short-patch-repair endonuclease
VALGGRLASANALESRGIWVDRVDGLVVHVSANAARLAPLAASERRTRRRLLFRAEAGDWRVSVADALVQLSFELAPTPWLASVDSALHRGAIRRETLEQMRPGIPAAHRAMLAMADGRAESGNETLLRVPLIAEGLTVEIQVDVPLIGRVDILIDGWLIVEVDSREHHGREAEQDRDRIRDGNALLCGFATVRFMPEAVRNAREWCLDVVRARLLQGPPVHRSGPDAETRRVLP